MKKGILLFFLWIIFIQTSYSQSIFAEGFEGYYPPAGWSYSYISGGPNWQPMPPGSGYQYAGQKCINSLSNQFFTSNSWIFSPGLNLVQGVSYRLSYWYKSGMAGRTEKMKVTIGAGQTIASQTGIVHDYPSITNTTYQQGIDVLTVPTTGMYNFAFQCYSGPGGGPGLLLDSVRVEYVLSGTCNSSPLQGNITGADSVCANNPFTLTLDGLYNLSGLSFQWQSSLAGQNVFTDISNATTNIYSFTQTSSRDYRCKITCTNTSQFVFSPVHSVVTPLLCYCTPPPGNCISAAGGFSIDSVSFVSIHNRSGCTGNGYTNYSTVIGAANVQAGNNIPVYILSGTNNGGAVMIVAVDFNQNGNFETTERTILTRSGNVYAGLVSIPFSSLLGATRMRISFSNGFGGSVFDNCGQPEKGETEDYSVNISSSGNTGPYYAYYVKSNATGANTGIDWENAFTDLGSALTAAHSGDTIKVAKGTYIPVSNNFRLKDSLILLGGYPNIGNPADADRNWSLNQTILSGNNTKRNIILCDQGVKPFTEINGFIFENGRSDNNSGNPVIPGVCISISNGGPTVLNCVFRNNKNYNSTYGGSAVYCQNSNAIFRNCFFINNQDDILGAIYCKSGGVPAFINCVFANNKSNNTIYSEQTGIKLTNCTFFNNRLEGNSNGNPKAAPISLNANTSATISNSIFYENKIAQTSDSSDIVLNTSSVNISNTITQTYNAGSPQLISVNPKFIDTSNIAGPDNFYFTADDGLRLNNPCSPAMNAGLNSAVSGITTDIAGNQRVFSDVVDLGAYEVQSVPLPAPSVIYVKAGATGANNGTSWANAFNNLQSAFQACSDTIVVAAGTYFASDNYIYSSFWLEKKRVVLGGYPITGNPTILQRDPAANPTILSGNLPGGNGSKTLAIIRGRNIDSTAILDGFIISDAKNIFNPSAAIYLSYGGSPLIRNTLIKNNISGYFAGGMASVFSSNPKLINCTFEKNGAINDNSADGGAVYILASSPSFIKCLFNQNSTWTGGVSIISGAAILNNNANPLIDSCVFFKNKANDNGGAIANFNNSSPLILNSKFIGNTLAGTGGLTRGVDIYNNNSSPVFKNCLFSDSAMADKGGAIANENSSNANFTACEFRNAKALYDGSICYNNNSAISLQQCVFDGSSLGSNANAISNNNNSTCKIVNSIAFNNSAYAFVGSADGNTEIINCSFAHNIIKNAIVHGGNGQLNIYNSLFWDNTKNNDPDFSVSPNTLVSISRSMTQYYGLNGINGNFVGINPRLIDITNAPGPDGVYYTADDGFALCSCSPAINNGLNPYIAGHTTDILNNPRVFNPSVDIGAYEFQSSSLTVPRAFYVRQNATGSGDGSSWLNAYSNLYTAIKNSCADTIKVSSGIYKPAISSRDSSYYINRGVAIFGGYPNLLAPNENLRNPDIYPTVISGEIGPLADSSDNTKILFQVFCPDTTTVLIDGLSFTRAFSSVKGALTAQNNKRLLIKNCRFYNNYTSGGSSALYSHTNNIEVDKCLFYSNGNGFSGDGTLRIPAVWGASVVKNSIFWNNSSNLGGAIHTGDSARLENCLFYGNSAILGAGIYLENNPNTKIIGCTFNKNNQWASTEYRGTDLYNAEGATPKVLVRNTVFKNQMFHNIDNSLDNSDWYHYSTSPGVPPALNVQYSVTRTGVPFVNNNIHSNNFSFLDAANPKGADNNWFTADDGLQPAPCVFSNDNGNNGFVSLAFDLAGQPRITNNIVDMGAYESQGTYVTISATDTSVCQGVPIIFTAAVINGGPTPTYQWQVNGVNAGTNSNVFTSSAIPDGGQVKVIVTSSLACLTGSPATSNVITIHTVNSISPSVSIQASSNNICSGTLVTFIATAINGGTNATYQWQVNGANAGTNSNVFASSSLLTGAQIKVILSSSYSCANPQQATSNIITVTVSPQITPSITISASSINICSGSSVTFTASPINGGTAPAYQWQINGINAGTNNNTFASSSLTNGAQIKTIMTSNASCLTTNTATSNIITMNVNNNVAPAILIGGNTTVTAGQSTTLSSTPTNGGTSPAYQWQDSTASHTWQNISGATGSTVNYTPTQTGVKLRCQLISNASCVSNNTVFSNVLTFTVTQVTAINPVPAAEYNIRYYPNPVHDVLYIDSLRIADKWETVEIFAMGGFGNLPSKVISGRAGITINVESLPAGQYIAVLRRKIGSPAFLKFIKL